MKPSVSRFYTLIYSHVILFLDYEFFFDNRLVSRRQQVGNSYDDGDDSRSPIITWLHVQEKDEKASRFWIPALPF